MNWETNLWIAFCALSILGCLIVIIWWNCSNSSQCSQLDKKTIIVCMTTIPERLQSEWLYNNLQSMSSFTIHLSIPPTFKKTGEAYIIPSRIKELSHVTVYECSEDWGPLTKVLGPIENTNLSNDTLLLICDDDIAYESHFVDMFMQSYSNTLDKDVLFHYGSKPEGYLGYMASKSVFKKCLENYEMIEACLYVDDTVIQHLCTKHHRVKGKFPFDKSLTDTHPEWSELCTDTIYPRNKMVTSCIDALTL